MKIKCFCSAALILLATVLFSSAVGAEAREASATTQVFQLPQSIEAGDGKEVSVLLDEGHLKLATISLRGGTVLPPHSAPVPATVHVLEGEGVIHAGSKAVTVSKGTIVLLAAGEEHDVVPSAGSDMLLLVHYLRGTPDATAPSTASHDH